MVDIDLKDRIKLDPNNNFIDIRISRTSQASNCRGWSNLAKSPATLSTTAHSCRSCPRDNTEAIQFFVLKMSGGVKRKLDNQSIEKKYEIILQLEKGMKPVDLSRQHGIPANTISGWKKKADVIKQIYEKSVFNPARKKLRAPEHKDVDDAVFQWFTNMRATNLPINGPLLMVKADMLAAKLGHPDFKASQGWLDRFKKRHNIVFKAVCGESTAVQRKQVDSWLKTQMHTILDNCKTKNIFNADENSVFWRCFLDETMEIRGEASHSGNKSKNQLTVVIANIDQSPNLIKDEDVSTDEDIISTDEDIVSSVRSAKASIAACCNLEVDADEDLETIPSASEVLEMLQKIRRYSSFVGGETVLDSINNIEAFVFKQTAKSILDSVKKSCDTTGLLEKTDSQI